MQWLARVCIERPVFATVLMLFISVLGIFSYGSLGVDAFPKIDFPVVLVISRLPGAAPQEMESQVTEKLEAAFNTISGVEELRSTSSESTSQVIIRFNLERDVEAAAQDVREKIAEVQIQLPKEVEAPLVLKLDPDASPVLYAAVSSESGDLRALTELADKRIRRDLENVFGVGQVNLIGGRLRQIHVRLHNGALRALNLSSLEVKNAIASENLSFPGGRIESGPTDTTVRIMGRFESPEQLGSLVVAQRQGRLVRLRDVADVIDGEEETETAALFDGKPTLIISVRKQSGSNTVKVVASLLERLEDLQKNLPPGVTLQVVRDNSKTIQTQVHAVLEHLILGSIFAALVVLAFLGSARPTAIAALSIPISIIGTFTLMAAQNFTLNVITLLALALAVGIVIDDAIVVLENVFRFIHEKKLPVAEAARKATAEIGLAVLATTLSLVAVFLPVAFMDGIVGRFLKSFGMTMSFSILVSLVVAFSLVPMLCARWLKADAEDKQGHPEGRILERMVDFFYRPLERAYMQALRWSLNHRWVIVSLCIATLGSCVPLFKAVPKNFLPENDEANFEINLRAPEGSSLPYTLLAAERIALATRQLPEVTHTVVSIGDNAQKTPNIAKIYVRLVNPELRKRTQAQVQNDVRARLKGQLEEGFNADVSDVSAFNAGAPTKTVQYIVSGPELEVLSELNEKILAAFRRVPGAVDVDSTFILGKPELQIHILRDKAADLGVSAAAIAQAVRIAIGGDKVSSFEERGETYDIRLRNSPEERAQTTDLASIPVPSSRIGTVALGEVTQQVSTTGPANIEHLARRRQITLTSNVAPGYSQSEVLAALQKICDDLNFPEGYRGEPTGQTREMGKAGKAFLTAFLLSFIFMYLILAAQFESWVHPFTILISLPLAVPFALISLLLFSQSLNIQSALGLLVLFGMVKKNGILQVDHMQQLRAEGLPRLEAILEGNRNRLRPILMTTLSFVAGMLPLVTARGIGAGFNRATAGIVVGGQSLSLVLTLLATPVLYSLLDDARLWLRGRRQG